MGIPCVVQISMFNGYETGFGWPERTRSVTPKSNQVKAMPISRHGFKLFFRPAPTRNSPTLPTLPRGTRAQPS